MFSTIFSDISFLCEATTAVINQNQQNKLSVQQRTTDKSAIRAIQTEFQQEPVCYSLIKINRMVEDSILGYCITGNNHPTRISFD
jgi:hypothetical protein